MDPGRQGITEQQEPGRDHNHFAGERDERTFHSHKKENEKQDQKGCRFRILGKRFDVGGDDFNRHGIYLTVIFDDFLLLHLIIYHFCAKFPYCFETIIEK